MRPNTRRFRIIFGRYLILKPLLPFGPYNGGVIILHLSNSMNYSQSKRSNQNSASLLELMFLLENK